MYAGVDPLTRFYFTSLISHELGLVFGMHIFTSATRMDPNLEANEMEKKQHLPVTLIGIAAIGAFVALLCTAPDSCGTEHSGHLNVVSAGTSPNTREAGQSHSSLHSDKRGYLRH